VPQRLTVTPVATGVRLDWQASTDDRPGYIGYEILRNDRVISPLVYGRSFIDTGGGKDDRYFVRSVDAESNRSATTAVAKAADTIAPTMPQALGGVANPDGTVTISWTASTDDTAIATYRVYRNGAEVLSVLPSTPSASATIGNLASGNHWFQVRAVDTSGNQSYKTPPIVVTTAATAADTQRPSTPKNVVAVPSPDGSITVTWSASTDNVGVTSYRVVRNLVAVATSTTTTASIVGLGSGNHYLQVQALDAAGNESARTAPVLVSIP
jgi:chitodextrinase